MRRTLLFVILLLLIPCFAQNKLEAPVSNPTALKFDEFEYDTKTDNEEIIDRFAQALKKAPNAKGYIIAYDARISRYGDVKARGVAGIAEFNLKMKVVNNISPPADVPQIHFPKQ